MCSATKVLSFQQYKLFWDREGNNIWATKMYNERIRFEIFNNGNGWIVCLGKIGNTHRLVVRYLNENSLRVICSENVIPNKKSCLKTEFCLKWKMKNGMNNKIFRLVETEK